MSYVMRKSCASDDIFAVATGGGVIGPLRSNKRRPIVLVSQAAIDEWAAEVSALPLRKRKRWKAQLLDQRGTISRVRYNKEGSANGPFHAHFEEYNVFFSTWLPIYSYEQTRSSSLSFDIRGAVGEARCLNHN